jgi:hypothetical protein
MLPERCCRPKQMVSVDWRPLTGEDQGCCCSDKAKEGRRVLAGLGSLQQGTACVEVHLAVLLFSPACDLGLV